jgi:glycosyltransferase 2 family protein
LRLSEGLSRASLTIVGQGIEYSRMLKNRLIYIVLSALVSVGLLWLLLSQVNTEDVIRTLSRIFIPALLFYMALALIAAWLRAWRYKWLLRPQPISWPNMFLVTFIRNSLIDLLPARLGSLSYIYVLNKRLGFPFEMATSSFVLAFVLDFLTISPFLVLSLIAVGLGSNTLSTPALLILAAAFFLLVFLVYWKLVPVARFLLAVFRRLLRFGRIEGRAAAQTAVQKFELTIQSLDSIRRRGKAIPIFVLSLLIRLAKYISVFALFFALLRSHGFALHDLSFWTFILGLSGAELTSALPIKGLAGFGTWESAWALTFGLMDFDPRLAVISGIGVHLLTNIFEYSLGIASILIFAWPYFRRKRSV